MTGAALAATGIAGDVRRTAEHTDQGAKRRWLIPGLVGVLYSTLAVWAYWPLYPGDPNRLLFRADADPGQHVWFFGWFVHALVSGHNPMWTGTVNVPYGLNVAQETGMPLLALVTLPVTLLVGPVSSVALCTVAAMPLSAMSMCWVLRRWKLRWPTAAIGGLLYGFSPYMLVQGTVHLDLIFLPLPPLIVASVVELLRGATRPRLAAARLAVLVVGQYFISGEVLAITLVIAVVGLALAGLYTLEVDPDQVRLVVRRSFRPLVQSCVLAAVLVGYPVWFQFEGPHRYVGPPWPTSNPWHGDALGFVAATPFQQFRPVLGGTGTLLTQAVGDENGMYIGVAVLVLSLVLLWIARASIRARLAFALTCVSGLLSLGTHLQVDRRDTAVPLPFDALVRLPGLSGILPIRFSFATGACLAAFVAFALDEIWDGQSSSRRAWSPARAGMTMCALTAVVAAVSWFPAARYATHPVRTLPASVERSIPGGDPVVLAYPYPLEGATEPMVWQTQDDFRFRLLGTYALVPGPTGRATEIPPLLTPAGVQELFVYAEGGWGYPYPPSIAQVEAEMPQFIEANHVGAVIVDTRATNGLNIARVVRNALGPPTVSSRGIDLWNVS